jgi:hypothetical protein
VSVPGFWNQRVPELLDEIVGMYRADGRALAGLADDELDASFVDAVDAYIADPQTPARFRVVNDVAAEYVLRRRAAPVLRVVRLREGTEDEAINQPDRRKLSVFIVIPGYEDILPMVVLAFGHYGTIPAVGAIFRPEGSDEDPASWDKLTGPELERAKERSRKWRDERHAEFEWLLLGRSAARAERVVSLNNARARRASA